MVEGVSKRLSKRVFGKAEHEPEHSKVQGSSSKNVVPCQAECREVSTKKGGEKKKGL